MKRGYKVDDEKVIEYYRELLKTYSEPTDDENVMLLQQLLATERNVMVLYIASDFKMSKTARLLSTNIQYTKKMIDEIRKKIISKK